MEPSDLFDSDSANKDRLTSIVAITIAFLAVFMGIFKIKDDNICQAMQQAQADRIDNWGWYQAHKSRLETAEATVDTLKAIESRNSIRAGAEKWEALVKKQAGEGNDVKAKAEDAEKLYNALNFRDDQFDMSDSAISVAIALLAVTALARKRWLYSFALIFAIFGLVMGLAGMFNWPLHPNALANFLGT
ncbi:MAG: DUF4337 domain-containing protein [Armatimonadota bacterium]